MKIKFKYSEKTTKNIFWNSASLLDPSARMSVMALVFEKKASDLFGQYEATL